MILASMISTIAGSLAIYVYSQIDQATGQLAWGQLSEEHSFDQDGGQMEIRSLEVRGNYSKNWDFCDYWYIYIYINLFHVILFMSHFSISADEQPSCELTVGRVGCFTDRKKSRSLRDMLANMRDRINWTDYAGSLEL